MKPRIPCIAAVITMASAGVAMAFYCPSERLEPVREVLVQPSTCLMEPSTTLDWGAPFRTAGRVISAPFVALGSAFSPSERYVEPVGERFTTVRIIRQRTVLEPVGEQCITLKRYHKTLLQPVGEQFITVRRYHKTLLQPVGERFISVKRYHKATLRPVGEKTILWKHHQKAMLKPVGEQFKTQKYLKKPMLKPVGEKTNIQKSSQGLKSSQQLSPKKGNM